MKQKLAAMISEGYSSNLVFPVKSKVVVRSQAMRRAWRTRKRMAQARADNVPAQYQTNSIARLRKESERTGT